MPVGNTTSDATFDTAGDKTVQLSVVGSPPENGKGKPKTCSATLTVTVQQGQAGGTPTARGDTYATPIGKTLTVQFSRVSGVL